MDREDLENGGIYYRVEEEDCIMYIGPGCWAYLNGQVGSINVYSGMDMLSVDLTRDDLEGLEHVCTPPWPEIEEDMIDAYKQKRNGGDS